MYDICPCLLRTLTKPQRAYDLTDEKPRARGERVWVVKRAQPGQIG